MLAVAVALGLRFLPPMGTPSGAALPPHGPLLFDLRPAGGTPRLNTGQGNAARDRITVRPEGTTFDVGTGGFAVIAPQGLTVSDFVAEARVRPLSGAGYLALQFHVGGPTYHLVRLDSDTGVVEARRAPSGPHPFDAETVLSASNIRVSPPAVGQVLQLVVVVRGSEIVAQVDGREVLRVNDAGSPGSVELAVGSVRGQPFSVELVDWRIYAPA